MARKRVVTPATEFTALRSLIYMAMAERGLRWCDVQSLMSVPMCTATLASKCQNPRKMSLEEMWDITDALGIKREEVRAAI